MSARIDDIGFGLLLMGSTLLYLLSLLLESFDLLLFLSYFAF